MKITPDIKEPQEKSVVVHQPNSPEALISQAITQGISVETMERLLAMRREIRAERAKEAFDLAMSEFQGECPVIVKSKEGGKTNSGEVAYRYAPLDIIVSKTKELIKKHGFSYAVKSETQKEGVKVKCIVKHAAGHSEESEIEVPLGTKTNIMSNTQQVAAAITFAKRYAFCNAFGILTGDEDNDAKPTQNKFDEASRLIENAKTIKLLMVIEERINASKEFSDEEKQELSSKNHAKGKTLGAK